MMLLMFSTVSALLREDTIRQESCSLVVVDYSGIGRGWQDQGIGEHHPFTDSKFAD